MHIVIVSIEVKPEYISDFLNITLYNAEHSILEPGIVRFDFYQEVDNPQKFSLVPHVEEFSTLIKRDDLARH